MQPQCVCFILHSVNGRIFKPLDYKKSNLSAIIKIIFILIFWVNIAQQNFMQLPIT